MILRKLEQEEHKKTRPLWEKVFEEDTKQFLDYYYYIKAKENEIYVIEEDDAIRAMLQLNPYRVNVEGESFDSAYIVAVATQREYRSRGFMRKLLETAMNGMYDRRIPFTFLMPAAEAIYTPYDFRYIYRQAQGVLPQKTQEDREIQRSEAKTGAEFADAALWDAEAMAEFFERGFSDKWQVYALRDAEYYRTMILEQQSEQGGVRLIREDGAIVGMFAYAFEDGLKIREPLYTDGYEDVFLLAAEELKDRLKGSQDQRTDDDPDGPAGETAKLYGCPEELSLGEKPLIMARILYLPSLLRAMKAKRGEELSCSFAVIDPILRQNSRVWKLESRAPEEEVHVRETEDSEGILPIAALTELLFGYRTVEEIARQEGVIMSERLTGELKKLKKLDRVFFNEVV